MSKIVQVIFCTDGIFPHAVGGMQRHSRLLIEELLKHQQIRLVVVHPHVDKVFEPHENLTEEPVAGIDESKNYLRETYRYSKRIARILEKYPEHLIYAQGLTVWYKAKLFKTRLIVNPHGLEPYQAISFKEKLIAIPFKKAFNKVFGNASKVVSLGGDLTRILENTSAKGKIVVLPNAAKEVEVFDRKTSKEKMKCFFLSRFASNKGIHILFEAIKLLNDKGYSERIEFVLGGKGPLWDFYKKNNTHNNVKLLGFVDDEDLPGLYQENDLFVFPTLFEGMPTVILEAMSHGMPVVATDVGAVRELVGADNGCLIDQNNARALVEALEKFYHLNNKEKVVLSQNSRAKFIKNFTWQKVAQQHLELFQSYFN